AEPGGVAQPGADEVPLRPPVPPWGYLPGLQGTGGGTIARSSGCGQSFRRAERVGTATSTGHRCTWGHCTRLGAHRKRGPGEYPGPRLRGGRQPSGRSRTAGTAFVTVLPAAGATSVSGAASPTSLATSSTVLPGTPSRTLSPRFEADGSPGAALAVPAAPTPAAA